MERKFYTLNDVFLFYQYVDTYFILHRITRTGRYRYEKSALSPTIYNLNYSKHLPRWEAKSGNVINILKGHENCVQSCAFPPDGSQIISAGDVSTLRLWDAQSGRMERIHALTALNSRDSGQRGYGI